MVMGKTWKDIKKFDIKRNKEGSRLQTSDMDMRTRVKPIEKKGKGGGKNKLRDILDSQNEEEDYESEMAMTAFHALTGE